MTHMAYNTIIHGKRGKNKIHVPTQEQREQIIQLKKEGYFPPSISMEVGIRLDFVRKILKESVNK